VRKGQTCKINIDFRLNISDSMPANESSLRLQGSKTARIAAWLLTAAIVILSLVPPSLRPETGAPHSVEHFTIYAAAGFAFGLGYKHR
jgi:hypothetical protein